MFTRFRDPVKVVTLAPEEENHVLSGRHDFDR